MTLNVIQTPILDDMRLVDDVIRQSLYSEVGLVNQVADYIIQSGGKRLRPMLVLLAAGALGDVRPAHHQVAAVVEFIHTATLLHDDVVDASSKRRGKMTANAQYGNAASVLVGDFVYSRAFQMMVALQNMRVMEVLSHATNVIAEGEVLQLLNVRNADISEENYLQVIRYKTAKLFEASAKLGAILSGASAQDEAALAVYGMHLGTAFQLIDDALDLTGDSEAIGKNLGDDLSEGKPTLPLLYAMQRSDVKDSQLIRQAITQGSAVDLGRIVEIVKASGALTHVAQLAQAEVAVCCAAIAHLKEGAHKAALIALANFAVARQY